MTDWQTFERHVTDALNLWHTDTNGTIHLPGRVSTGRNVESVLADLRGMNTLPQLALRQLENDYASAKPLLDARGEQLGEADEWHETQSRKWHKTSATGRVPSVARQYQTQNTLGNALSALDAEHNQNNLRKLVVDAYRRLIRQRYQIGSPNFNRYYF